MTSRGRRKYSQVTITAPIATSVPNQRVYTGRKPAIPSSIADAPCTELGIDKVLKEFNTTLRTRYTLNTPSLRPILEECISRNYDFGTAYARLRPMWYNDFTTTQSKWRQWEAEDREMRQQVRTVNPIIEPTLPPRRVWDLYSNRVVPWWIARQWPWGISHAWMDREDRPCVWTPINGYEWATPIPKDANLDLIRIEMLNLGAKYAWLDVLCLRMYSQRDYLRVEEWKLDIPTIGYVFQEAKKMVCYFSGLGRPLRFKMGDFESDLSWFRRAWTLQEINGSYVIGGEVGKLDEDVQKRFDKELSSLERIRRHASDVIDVFEVLSHVQKLVSTNPVDKIAGLAYVLDTTVISAYYEAASEEDAWMMLVNAVAGYYRGQLLFLYPQPGNETEKWRPSWRQVMTEILPTAGGDQLEEEEVDRDEKTDISSYSGFYIESGYVHGLDKGDPHSGQLRRGELIVKDAGNEHTFEIVANHQFPVPEDSYVLIGSLGEWKFEDQLKYWVAGRRLSGSELRFEKVSVFKMADEKEIQKLKDLDIVKESHFILA
ncbi:hypothetical protein DFS33DRAFT_226457 [Desarmillaria ectypa]|nr:hypothetical protein DFS33DRAFT_226457 [Desarmillaria ectypa]